MEAADLSKKLLRESCNANPGLFFFRVFFIKVASG
jgi:hypothetical protein